MYKCTYRAIWKEGTISAKTKFTILHLFEIQSAEIKLPF